MLRTVAELLAALLAFLPETPICVAIGQGVVCAPVKVELACMKPALDRPGWYDRHREPGCPEPMEMVLVISETTRTESARAEP